MLASDLRPEWLLFHEAPSRIMLSTAHPEAVAEIAARHGVVAVRAGITIEAQLEIRNQNATLVSATIESLRAIYEGSLENQIRS
jgi:phosphoribosylformylglycinamidine synthase